MNSYSVVVKEPNSINTWLFRCKASNIGLARQKVWEYDFNLIILGTVKTNKRGDCYDD